MNVVLFLCSGNYYRSRFAESLFNHLAAPRGLPWRAHSSGLKIDLTRKVNVGPLSTFTLDAFRQRSIPHPDPLPFPKQVTQDELAAASLIIALKEAEHRALMRKNFPDWENRVTYWHVHDLDKALPEETLAEIDRLTRSLVDRLAASESAPAVR